MPDHPSPLDQLRRVRRRAGRCYELCNRLILDQPSGTDLVLVHGEVDGPDGTRVGHAWLERGETVLDPVLGEELDRPSYCRRYGAVTAARFTQREAARRMLADNHHGPWLDVADDASSAIDVARSDLASSEVRT